MLKAIKGDRPILDNIKTRVDSSSDLSNRDFLKGSIDTILNRKVRIVPDDTLVITHFRIYIYYSKSF